MKPRQLASSSPDPQWLTRAEAAARIGVNPRTIDRRIAEGMLQAYRTGPLIRVKAADVDALMVPMLGGAA